MFRHPIDTVRVVIQLSVLVSAGAFCTFADVIGAPMPPTLHAAPRQGKAEQVFSSVCGRCHPVERITATRRTRSQWEETITTMITTRGAQISDEEFDTILTYLTQEYGRVDVNRAPADAIAEVLSTSDDVAAAIVAYRKEHGPFEDFEALVKVPGVNREALEKKRDAITF